MFKSALLIKELYFPKMFFLSSPSKLAVKVWKKELATPPPPPSTALPPFIRAVHTALMPAKPTLPTPR
jgi:hypothetical protein